MYIKLQETSKCTQVGWLNKSKQGDADFFPFTNCSQFCDKPNLGKAKSLFEIHLEKLNVEISLERPQFWNIRNIHGRISPCDTSKEKKKCHLTQNAKTSKALNIMIQLNLIYRWGKFSDKPHFYDVWLFLVEYDFMTLQMTQLTFLLCSWRQLVLIAYEADRFFSWYLCVIYNVYFLTWNSFE